MKKGFTLVEMLIVVVVLVTLMTITFRLSSLGDDQTRRSATISRLQRLENCLSGYYAAFGTYPPVKEHGYSTFHEVNVHGIQQVQDADLHLDWYKPSGDRGIGSTSEVEDWKIVQATCLCQPLATRFPYPEGYDEYLKAQAELAKERVASGEDTNTDPEHLGTVNGGYDDGYSTNPGRHDLSQSSWTECQLFQFGVMSYLLPRYMVMMSSGENANQLFNSKQWTQNNALPCRPSNGRRYDSWAEIKSAMRGVTRGASDIRGGSREDYDEVKMMPSQSVCTRWLPNLEKSCYTGIPYRLYGIDIADPSQRFDCQFNTVFSPGGSQGGSYSQQYVLNLITMTDGWHHELYYHSPAPYQSYVVWSAGPNGRTYPPWMTREGLGGDKGKCISVWIEDDIVNMSN